MENTQTIKSKKADARLWTKHLSAGWDPSLFLQADHGTPERNLYAAVILRALDDIALGEHCNLALRDDVIHRQKNYESALLWLTEDQVSDPLISLTDCLAVLEIDRARFDKFLKRHLGKTRKASDGH